MSFQRPDRGITLNPLGVPLKNVGMKLCGKMLAGLLLLLSTAVVAQDWDFKVSGKVEKAGKKLDGAIVTLYQGSSMVKQVTTSSSGKFDFTLMPNSDYMITVTKSGHITKRFSFNTRNVPDERGKAGFAGMDMTISIFDALKGVDYSILNQPLAKVKYETSEEDFDYDKAYTQSIQDALRRLQELEEQSRRSAEENYKNAVARGDKAFAAKDYTGAKAAFTEATNFKPEEQYPKTKIAECDKMLASMKGDQEKEQKYKDAITRGDQNMTVKEWAGAKAAYTEALGIKPNEAYPKQKIAEIDKLFADQQKQRELDEKYRAAIANADKSFNTKLYSFAKSGYEQALLIKPNEQYPKDKIAEIAKLLAAVDAEKAKEQKYKDAITKGDNAFNGKDYAGAKAAYNEALGIKPGEKYPTDRIIEIDGILAKLSKDKELEDAYKAAVAKGDKGFDAKDYSTAKAGYNEALTLKPSEQYPKDRLAEITRLLAAAEADKLKDERYKAVIAKADLSFNGKDYAGAKVTYNEALGIKPGEKYPTDRIAECDKLLGDIAKAKEADVKYKEAIVKADNSFKAKEYLAAKTFYTEAMGFKPEEKYPRDRIAECDRLMGDLAKKKELDEKYNAAIAKADQAFAGKDYQGAKGSYNEALGIKPAEAYPKQKIAEIDKLLADMAKTKDLEEKYKQAIEKGDKGFGAQDYTTAKAAYNEALGYKSAEKYPKDKIAEIDRLLAEQAKNAKDKELNEKYNAAIAKADAAFTAADYSAAKTSYNAALGFKPAEKYPKDKLAEIDRILTDAAKNKQLEDRYNAAIAKGDKGFAAKDYGTAKIGYNEALAVKPGEQYPKDKLAEIDKILGDMAKGKEREKNYLAAITKADAAFKAKDYNGAKGSYTEAQGIKPEEKYPADRIAECDRLLAELAKGKEAEQKYNDAIARGDKAFGAKDYENAKTAYNDALGVKPAEVYPKNKIYEIDKILADIAKNKDLEERYKNAIAKADATFASKEYNMAKAGYTEAASIKPAEKYPKDKLAEIDRLLAELAKTKDLEQKYQNAIAKGDKGFGSQDYTSAKAAYNEALGYKPSEKYPKDKLAEIEKLMAEKDRLAKEKELNDKYNAAIARGDAAFGTQDYVSAKTAYTDALGLKPAEKYPKDKLAEVDKLLAALNKGKELENAYKAAIAKADKAFDAKDYTSAKGGYSEASGLKPAEKYPKDRLKEIEKLLADMAKNNELMKKYNEIIARADQAFTLKDYPKARNTYTEALGVKPDEKYPKDKIAEIDKLVGDMAKDKELQAKYNDAIARADKAFTAKDYEGARPLYSEASSYKPNEQYPKDRMKEIDGILDRYAKDHEADQKYNDAMARADKAFGIKDYAGAKSAYTEALNFKPNEKYPKAKIAEIDKILDAQARGAENDKKFQEAIEKADKLFADKEYRVARVAYSDALTIKPSEKYPKDRIKEIDELLKKVGSATTVADGKAEDERKKAFMNALLAKYGPGVTEETQDEPNCKVIRRIVVKDNEANVYTKKIWNWGGTYYFKNDVSISDYTFEAETKSK